MTAADGGVAEYRLLCILEVCARALISSLDDNVLFFFQCVVFCVLICGCFLVAVVAVVWRYDGNSQKSLTVASFITQRHDLVSRFEHIFHNR